jgi:hypothetical protein
MAGGPLARPFIERLGLVRYSYLTNAATALSYCLKGLATGPAGLLASLLPYLAGGQAVRTAGTSAMAARHGAQAGWGGGEVAAVRSNCIALMKVVMPQVYAWLYIRQRSHRGMPYFAAAALVVASQALLAALAHTSALLED